MDGYVTIGTELDTKNFEEEIRQTESKLNRLEKAYERAMNPPKGMKTNEKAVENLRLEIEKTSNRLVDLRSKQAKLGDKPPSGILEWLKNLGKETEKNIRKVGRWALAIFGIRTAYNAVRNAMSVISSHDKQLAADIEYMKNALAYTLEPIVRAIVNLMKQLMFYVAYIVQRWTGKNIFENANKSLQGANKEAKALSKTMAGFDEMNVLSDTSGGGGSTDVMPSFDLSQIQGEVPEWLKWLGDNGEFIQTVILGIGSALVGLKLGQLLQTLGLFTNLPIWQLAGGIGLIIFGVGVAIKGVIDFLKDPTWQNFLTILQGISLVVAGIAVLMGGWVVALVAVGVAIVTSIIKNWDTVKGILGKVGGWIYDNVLKPIGSFFKATLTGALSILTTIFNQMVSFFKGVVSAIIGIFAPIGTAVGNVLGGAFKAVINGVLWSIETILNTPIKAINTLISAINAIPGIKLSKLSTFKLPRLAKGGIINMPGRGIPVGSAITGERGQEGVIPLTDSQQMALLGEAIGKYININATVPVYVGNRQIAREIRKIEAENDFAFNN